MYSSAVRTSAIHRVLGALLLVFGLIAAVGAAPRIAFAEPDPSAGEVVLSIDYDFSAKTVEQGTPLEDLGLPSEVNVSVGAESGVRQDTAAVVWSGAYDPNTPAVYKLTMSFANPDLEMYAPYEIPEELAPEYAVYVDVADDEPFFGDAPTTDLNAAQLSQYAAGSQSIWFEAGQLSKGVYYKTVPSTSHTHTLHFKGLSSSSAYDWDDAVEVTLYDSHGNVLDREVGVGPEGMQDRLIAGLTYYYGVRGLMPQADEYHGSVSVSLLADESHDFLTDEELFAVNPGMTERPHSTPSDCNEAVEYMQVCRECHQTFWVADAASVGHDYGSDGVCTKCGHVDGTDDLVLGEERRVFAKNNSNSVDFQFTPEYTHHYYIHADVRDVGVSRALPLSVTVHQIVPGGEDVLISEVGVYDTDDTPNHCYLLAAGSSYRVTIERSTNYTSESIPAAGSNGTVRIHKPDNIAGSVRDFHLHAHAADATPISQTPATDCAHPGSAKYRCAVCGLTYDQTLVIPHSFVDGVCTVCGQPEHTPTIAPGEEKTVTLNQTAGVFTTLEFTPEYSHYYRFEASTAGNYYISASIYEASGNSVYASNSGTATNPKLEAQLEAGKTYRLGVAPGYGTTGGSGEEATVKLSYLTAAYGPHEYSPELEYITEPTCKTWGRANQICTLCGVKREISTSMASHQYGPDHVCTVCEESEAWCVRQEHGYPAEVWLDDGAGAPVKLDPDAYDTFCSKRSHIDHNPDGSTYGPYVNLEHQGLEYLFEWLRNYQMGEPANEQIFDIDFFTGEYQPLHFTLTLDQVTNKPTIIMGEGQRGKAEVINLSQQDPETGAYDETGMYGEPLYDIKLTFAKADPSDKPATIETVDTNQYGFTINLFDYLIGTDDSKENAPLAKDWQVKPPALPSQGMNAYSPLKFFGGYGYRGYGPYAESANTSDSDSNRMVGSGVSLQGVVLPAVGEDGYPVATEYGNPSLGGLFDETSIEGAKTSYLGVNHLLSLDDRGMLSYDSDAAYAYYDPAAGSAGDFVVYDGTYEITRHSGAGANQRPFAQTVGFMPFDDYNSLRSSDVRSVEGAPSGIVGYDRHYGFSMTGAFTLPASLKTEAGDDFVFEFGGDDDAWLFVDGVLVAEVAGMHEGDSVAVDFTTGAVSTSPVIDMVPSDFYNTVSVTVPETLGSSYTLADAFANAGKTWDPTAEHEFAYYRLNRISSTPRFSIATNLHEATVAPVVSVPVAKEWADGAAAHAGDAVTVLLLADGVEVADATLELSAANGWQSAFTGLPKYAADGTTEVVYTVRELPVSGWHATYEQGGELVRTATYWVPVDPADLTVGETYAIVADSDVGAHLAENRGLNKPLAAGAVIVHHDAKSIAGTTYPSYLTSVADNQKWTLSKSWSGWNLTNQGMGFEGLGYDSSYGITDERVYSYRTFNQIGWLPEAGGNWSNGLSIDANDDGTALIGIVFDWGTFKSPKEYLSLGTMSFGNVLNASAYVQDATPVTFYRPVTVDEPYEAAGMWTVTNSNRVGDLAVSVESAGKGAGAVSPLVTVTLDDDTVAGTYGDFEFAGGVATATVPSDATALVARDLPEGVGYTVAGAAVAGYQGPEVAAGKVAFGEAAEARLLYAFGSTPAEAVENLIEDLPDPDDVTPGDKDAIEDARDAYDKLSDEDKAKVDPEDVAKLEDDEAALEHALTTPVIERIWGDYANETSAKISAKAFEASEWVVLARDDDFADALGAVGVAGALDAPIVLTDRTALSPAAAAEIQRLGAKSVYIIGGTGAMKEQLEADLAGAGVTFTDRLWGENSYDTSLACAKKIVELGGKSDEVVIAMSLNFQDALSISPYAYKYKVPVVLQTWGDTSADRGFTDEAKQWLTGKSVLVAGGAGAISEASVAPYELVDRLWGESGYDTSNKIADWMTSKGYLGTESIVFACGAQAPKGTDALAGAALAGKLSAPILLATSNEAMEAADLTTVNGFYKQNAASVKHTYVLGGAYVMPQALYQQIQGMNSAEDISE